MKSNSHKQEHGMDGGGVKGSQQIAFTADFPYQPGNTLNNPQLSFGVNGSGYEAVANAAMNGNKGRRATVPAKLREKASVIELMPNQTVHQLIEEPLESVEVKDQEAKDMQGVDSKSPKSSVVFQNMNSEPHQRESKFLKQKTVKKLTQQLTSNAAGKCSIPNEYLLEESKANNNNNIEDGLQPWPANTLQQNMTNLISPTLRVAQSYCKKGSRQSRMESSMPELDPSDYHTWSNQMYSSKQQPPQEYEVQNQHIELLNETLVFSYNPLIADKGKIKSDEQLSDKGIQFFNNQDFFINKSMKNGWEYQHDLPNTALIYENEDDEDEGDQDSQPANFNMTVKQNKGAQRTNNAYQPNSNSIKNAANNIWHGQINFQKKPTHAQVPFNIHMPTIGTVMTNDSKTPAIASNKGIQSVSANAVILG